MIQWNELYAMLGDTPMWLSYLIVSVVLAYTATVIGVLIGKAGYSPFWGFLALLPWIPIAVLAYLAWGKWKRLPNRNYPADTPSTPAG